MNQRHRLWLSIFGIAAASLLGITPACSKSEAPAAKGKPQAVATIFAYYDILRSVGGDRISSRVLIPPRTSPHDYSSNVQDKLDVTHADLIVKNGLGLDDWVDRLASTSKAAVVTVGKDADVLKTVVTELDDDHDAKEGDKAPAAKKEDAKKDDDHDHDHAGHEHHHDHAPGMGNPHIWLDPQVQMKATEAVRDALIKIDPAGTEIYKANADKYLSDLKQLDSDFKSAVASFKTREFIGFHSAYDYLARRYSLVQAASLEELPGSGISPAQAQKIINMIKEKNVKVIFTETALDSRGADIIIRNTGVKTAILQPIETYDNMNDSYVSLMRQNLENLKQALGS